MKKLACAVFAALFLLAFAHAEELPPDPNDPEVREAAEEDAAESKLSEVDQIAAVKNVKGVITLGDGGTGNPAVVGQILSDSGESYFLKLEKKELLKKLQGYAGKTATLTGKLRNKNKYLIVQAIADAGSAPAQRTKRGGI